jgi:hypothetical protein
MTADASNTQSLTRRIASDGAPGGAACTLTNSRFLMSGSGCFTPVAAGMASARRTIAAAKMTPLDNSERTVRTSFLPSSGPAPPGSRARLVDAVMDLPEVQDSSRMEATVPLGDAESLERLRDRTDQTVTRPAGSTALVDGDIPPASPEGPGEEPGSEAPAS